jgi:hypothetical protein
MCELPPRSWRDAINASRIAIAVAALGSVAIGLLVRGAAASLSLLAFGAILLVAAVVLPSIQQLEFGFPAGFKVVTAVRDREAALRRAFENQRPEFELVANLLCEDPAVAAKLLEAAWGKAAESWRGPVTADLHDYVLCTFAHLLTAHEHWAAQRGPTTGALSTVSQLNMIELRTRIVIVFHEFGDVPLRRLSSIVGQSVEQMQVDMQAANAMLTARVATEGSPA